MDFIQRTVSLFSKLLQRIKQIGSLLSSGYLPDLDRDDKDNRFFWIFNW